MKNTLKNTLLSLVLIAIAPVVLAPRAAAQKPDFEITKVQPSVIRTPDYQFSGEQRKAPRPGQWLEVEVEFEARPELTEELTVRYFIKFAGQCLTGEVTHVSILAGRDLHSVMYVPPATISRLLNGKPLTGNSIEDVGVQLVRRGQVLATKSFKAAGDAQWWQTMQQIPGLVMNKNETPFAPLYWDRYEAIKAAGR